MAFSYYIQSGGKHLRCGYTTGTCAALAAAGAVRLLLTETVPESVWLITPKGIRVEVPLEDPALTEGRASCAVRKDAGDDIDVTDGLLIYAAAEFSEQPGITILGGEGVGRVTRPGLDQPVGSPAINRVPRQMIREAVADALESLGHGGGIQITIFVPGGREIAQKTFNPQLGVVDGISILGTSGIVEPMSTQALIDTIALEIRQKASMGCRHLILTPGNYGMDYLKRQGLDQAGPPVVKCSNYIGDAIDSAGACGIRSVLLVGHVGKLVKLAGGIMNTHSRVADCRMELLCAHGALCGADAALCQQIMDAATTDAALELLKGQGLMEPVMDSLMKAISRHLRRRAGAMQIGAIVFSNVYGTLGTTETVPEILAGWKEEPQ